MRFRFPSTLSLFLSYAIPVSMVFYGYHNYGMLWIQTLIGFFLFCEFMFLFAAGLIQFILQPASESPNGIGLGLGKRCQKLPPDYSKFWGELFESSRCMFMIALMGTGAIMRLNLGEKTGLYWELPVPAHIYTLQFLFGAIFADGWLYLKHRLLHSPALYMIHKHHHTFKNPSAFAGFAIHPIETLWTFAPIALWYLPSFPHYLPVFVPAVIGFFLLNSYLHCGYCCEILERVLPMFFLNSSAFHNVHHEKTNTHFGEIASFWDWVLGTSAIYKEGAHAGYRWHVNMGLGVRLWEN